MTEPREETLAVGLSQADLPRTPPPLTLVSPWSSGISFSGSLDLLIVDVRVWLGQAPRQTTRSRKLRAVKESCVIGKLQRNHLMP